MISLYGSTADLHICFLHMQRAEFLMTGLYITIYALVLYKLLLYDSLRGYDSGVADFDITDNLLLMKIRFLIVSSQLDYYQ